MSDNTAAPAAEPIETTSTPSPSAPGGLVPAQVEQPDASHDADDFDLLSYADDADEDEAEGEEAPETTIRPLGPGEEATDDEIAAWRAEHGIPDDVSGYEAPTIDGIAWDQEALGPVLEAVHAHNVPQQAVADALAAYAERVQAQRARMAETDKTAKADLVASLKDELGNDYTAFKSDVDGAFKGLPKELRTALRTARLPDGNLLINMPETLHMLRALGSRRDNPQPKDRMSTLQRELRDIDALMNTEIDTYTYKPWRSTGKSASARRTEIMRELNGDAPARPSAAQIKSEEQELLALHARDPQLFEYAKWRDSGVSGAERLHRIRMGRV